MMTRLQQFRPALDTQLARIRTAYGDTIKRLAAVKKRLAVIEKMGHVDATIYWRKGKFAYLHHRIVRGSDKPRIRKYIGSNASQIALAQAKIDRHKERERLQDSESELEGRLVDVRYKLDECLADLKAWR